MKLADWARGQGIRYRTAYDWFRKGILPVPSRQMPTGTILVYPEDTSERGTALYARVSAVDQRADLDRQLARLSAYAAEREFRVAKVVGEVGPGLNGRRPRLLTLLRDRLARFGSEYIEAALAASGRRLVVMDPEERKDDLVRDMLDVLTSFCTRLHGRRAARNRAERAMSVIEARP